MFHCYASLPEANYKAPWPLKMSGIIWDHETWSWNEIWLLQVYRQWNGDDNPGLYINRLQMPRFLMAFFVGTMGKSSLNTSFSTKIFAALDNDPASYGPMKWKAQASPGSNILYPVVMTNIAMENGPFIDGLPNLKMVIFHGYVK